MHEARTLMEEVLVAGLGAIGSLFASYLSSACRVSAVGRAWHVNEIRRRGHLLLKSVDGSVRKVKLSEVYDSFSALGGRRFDVVIVSVKAHDTEGVLRELVEYGVEAECYALLQNGYGNEEVAKAVLGDANIVRMLTNNGAYIESPGVVVHAGLGETFVGGVYGPKSSSCAESLAELLARSGLPAKFVDDVRVLVFSKLVVNAVINPLTALLGVKNRAVAEDPELRSLAEDIVKEVVSAARAVGVYMDFNKALSTVLKVAAATGENVSSMLQDVMRGRRTEVDFINGAVMRLAGQAGLEAPINACLYRLVKSLERLAKREDIRASAAL